GGVDCLSGCAAIRFNFAGFECHGVERAYAIELLSPHTSRVPLAGRSRVHRARTHLASRTRRLFRPTSSCCGWFDTLREPARAEEAALRRAGQGRDLPVHVRRTEPHRYVRLQT